MQADLNRRLANQRGVVTTARAELAQVARKAAAGNHRAEALIPDRKKNLQQAQEHLIELEAEYSHKRFETGRWKETFTVALPDDHKHRKFNPPLEGEDQPMFVFQSPQGEQLGVQFLHDGSLSIGGWNREGEWTNLVVKQPCPDANCYSPGHSLPFDLKAYVEAGEPQGRLFD
jgi:hypothetical protein